MALSNSKLYKAHVKNLQAVAQGLNNIQRQLNTTIGAGDGTTADTLLKIYLLLAGAWSECRLRKLLYEQSGFSDDDRGRISAERSQILRWQRTLEIGFRKRYRIPSADLSERSLPHTAWARFSTLKRLLSEDLEPLIEMRNALAHGQWARPLTSDESDISEHMCAKLSKENRLSAGFKLQLISYLAELLHDLVASELAFERDFDFHYKMIISAKENLHKRKAFVYLAKAL